jgi:cadmium resistance protein CadD (predicted permease)
MIMLLVFLLSYNVTACICSNYLTVNRHSEAFIPVWFVLLGLLYYVKMPSSDEDKKS